MPNPVIVRRVLANAQGPSLPTRGLLSVYPFTDNAGTSLTDTWGGQNGTFGTTTTKPTWGTNQVAFTATQFISLPALSVPIYGMDIAFFIGSSEGASSTAQRLWGVGNGSGLILGPATGLLTNEIVTVYEISTDFGVGSSTASGWCDGVASIAAGWHLIQWNFNSGIEIYLDGVKQTLTTSGSPTFFPSSKAQKLGALASINLVGSLAWVSTYGASRTLPEINQTRTFIRTTVNKRAGGVTLP